MSTQQKQRAWRPVTGLCLLISLLLIPARAPAREVAPLTTVASASLRERPQPFSPAELGRLQSRTSAGLGAVRCGADEPGGRVNTSLMFIGVLVALFLIAIEEVSKNEDTGD